MSGGDHPSERRRHDEVGAPGGPAAGGGGHTAEQAAITDMGAGARSDADREAEWGRSGERGRDPPHPGGASGGHAERRSSRGDATVVSGQSKAEREQAGREAE